MRCSVCSVILYERLAFGYFTPDTNRFEKTRSAILFDRIQQVLAKL